MPTPGFGTSPFVLPQMFDKPGDALQQGLLNKERRDQRQFEINYRLQKEKEADDWRKLNLIQDLTNIDKYQTGEAVADAIGHQKAQDLFQKYTAQASSLSPAELQYKISQDIGKTTLGMQGMKDELVQKEADIKRLKALHPALSDNDLLKTVRSEILMRRIKGNDFANPIDANQPSTIDLTNPDTLSDYIDVNKGLREAVVNPKNIQKDVTVLRGNRDSYVGYQGDLPFFMKDAFETKGGFYNQPEEPKMALRTDIVPQGAFSGANKPIEVLDKRAYDILASENPDAEMALRKLAKTKYGNYNEMSDSEKEIARRDVAKDFIQPFAENYKYRSKTANPPHYSSTTNVYSGGGISGIAKGNLIDKIDLAYYGSPKNGRIDDADVKIIPADLQAVLKSSGIDISDAETVKIEIENGKIMAITPSGGKRIDRVAVENAQKKFNTEGQKQPQPDFETVIPTVVQPGSGGIKPSAEKKRIYKGLDKDGNPIFE